MSTYRAINSHLKKLALAKPPAKGIFFKTGPGDYAEHDKFMGISNILLRKLSKEYQGLGRGEIQLLIQSKFNEERMLALFILILQYQKGTRLEQEKIVQFYLKNLKYVNNWNLVDASAHLILGRYLFFDNNSDNVNDDILLVLSKSKILWERRVAVVATWYFIRNNKHNWTYRISKILLNDKHDLIHKAVGWMLRESGKKNKKMLITFLNDHASKMPRTMLRYAIEKFPNQERKTYLSM